ncbi:NAD(P)/FAD-dependent oxidoreductase [Paenibacillus sp. NPDC058071]|uniref:NAD(P)/FAD-dependent oxidoreductase n=1 Tax=Paenibacillus sp. NPDC058071 TaxID=3346326 RepID=UPI0036D85C72
MKLLHAGNLYWPSTIAGLDKSYPSLNRDLKVNVLIVGGGMSGTICGYALAESGVSAAVVERGRIAGGSTSANTGLLQFCNDIMLTDLIDQIGERDAVTFYEACRGAVLKLGGIAGALNEDVGFIPRSSLFYASSESDLPKLRREYESLQSHGFDVSFLDSKQLSSQFPFSKAGAIVTRGDAEVNPLQFVKATALKAASMGLQIYENSDVVSHERDEKSGIHRLRTSAGCSIEAEHVIFAVGYEPEELRTRLVKAKLNRSFAAVTERQDPDSLSRNWPDRCLIWETAHPYLYMRTTVDNRIVIGGLDEDPQHPVEDEQALDKRIDQLREKLLDHFPALSGRMEYKWSATFGESQDNLPFIGEDPAMSGAYYCLGYGGNGTVYSAIAGFLLRDRIQGVNNRQEDLTRIVGLNRNNLQKV